MTTFRPGEQALFINAPDRCFGGAAYYIGQTVTVVDQIMEVAS